MPPDPKEFLIRLFQVAVASANPEICLPGALADIEPALGRTVVVGAGKAAGSMAATLERHWRGPLEGVVVAPYGYAGDSQRIQVLEASHPVPDRNAKAAAEQIIEQVSRLTERDLVIGLWSGGGSSIMALPGPGVTLADKQNVSRELLRSGASISEINCVRKHLSRIKGGRLALAAFPARVVSLVISDVPGDDLAVVASGPMFPDPTTCDDARAVMRKYGIDDRLALTETPKPDDLAFARTKSILLATAQLSLEAAAECARGFGIRAEIISDRVEGESNSVGSEQASRALATRGSGPCVLLSGGETTVTLGSSSVGRGGRNVEFLASLADSLDGASSVYGLAADTDGIDGMEPIAGAYIDPTTKARAKEIRMELQDVLRDHDAHTLFQRLGDQVVTGPTLTNVNDFRAILIAD